MDLKIEAKFMGPSVVEKMEESAQSVIKQEVSPVTPKFLIVEHTFTDEMDANEVLTLTNLPLTTDMKIISTLFMFASDYFQNPDLSYSSSGVGYIGVSCTQESSDNQKFGMMGVGQPTDVGLKRPMLYVPDSNGHFTLNCLNFETTTGLTGKKVRGIVEYIDLSV